MSALSRLTVASRSDVEANRLTIRNGLLKSKGFLAGPWPASSGAQAAHSGLYFRRDEALIVQLSSEIQCMVLGYLEPVWLFQLEEAYPPIAKLLLTPIANKIWYNSLPPALMVEPEHFQNENEVRRLSEAQMKWVNHSDASISIPNINGNASVIPAAPIALTDALHTLPKYASPERLIVLPRLGDMSALSRNVHVFTDIRHPSQDPSYPLIVSQERSARVRVLALGGPFRSSITYRQELAGHLHSAKRCQMCCEFLTESHGLCPPRDVWDMRWCRRCLKQWTVSAVEIAEVKGFEKLFTKFVRDNTWLPVWHGRIKVDDQLQWRPFVDDVARKELGIDFETALAKENYLKQVLGTLRRTTCLTTLQEKPISAHRRQLRRDIVSIAKTSLNVGFDTNPVAVFARSTFASAEDIGNFLFHPRLLDVAEEFKPYDSREHWLPDPTTELISCRDVLNRSEAWKTQKAVDMLHCLFSKCKVTRFIRAADSYHINRISNSITAEKAIARLNQTVPFDNSPFFQYPERSSLRPHLIRLEVILTKLHIYRSSNPHLPQLSTYNLEVAKKVYFKKLLLQCCVACPYNSLLAKPRGIKGVLEHFRHGHGDQYWGTQDWNLVG